MNPDLAQDTRMRQCVYRSQVPAVAATKNVALLVYHSAMIYLASRLGVSRHSRKESAEAVVHRINSQGAGSNNIVLQPPAMVGADPRQTSVSQIPDTVWPEGYLHHKAREWLRLGCVPAYAGRPLRATAKVHRARK